MSITFTASDPLASSRPQAQLSRIICWNVVFWSRTNDDIQIQTLSQYKFAVNTRNYVCKSKPLIIQLVATASTLHMCVWNMSVRIPVDAPFTLAKRFYGFSQPLEYNVADCISENPRTFTTVLQFFRHKPSTIDDTWPGMSTSSDTKPELRSGGTSTTTFTAVLVGTRRIIVL